MTRWPAPLDGAIAFGGIHEIPLPAPTAGRMWLCGKHVAAVSPDLLLDTLGADTIVCLTERHEVADRWTEYVPWMEQHQGSRSIWRPIGDLSAPNLDEVEPFFDDLVRRLRDGAGLVVHCAAGIGRSGTTAVAVLVLLGMPLDAAIGHVRAHRPMAGPEVGSQRELVTALAERVRTPDGSTD